MSEHEALDLIKVHCQEALVHDPASEDLAKAILGILVLAGTIRPP